MSNASSILIAGAVGGIGSAVVDRALAQGYSVIALVRIWDQRARDLQSRSGVLAVLDASQGAPSASRLREALGERSLSGFVWCVGVSEGGITAEQTSTQWHKAFDVNVGLAMDLARVCFPLLQECRGSAVFVGSPVAMVGARKVAYAASKAALIGLVAALSAEWAPRGVRVNGIVPGATRTPMTADWSHEKRAAVASTIPLGRMAEAAEMAGPIAFLLSPDASFMTGAWLNVTGGAYPGVGA